MQPDRDEQRTGGDRRRTTRGGRRITDLRTHDESFVTPAQLATHLGVGRRQVMKWIEAGALVAYRFDERQWRIEITDARAFVARSRFDVQKP